MPQSSFIKPLGLPSSASGNSANGYTSSMYSDWVARNSQAVPNASGQPVSSLQSAEPSFLQNGEALAGYAGLANSLLQAAALPGQMKLAKVQRQGLEQNLAQAKADSAIKTTARNNLNTHRLGA